MRKLIIEKLNERGLTMKGASLKIGMSHSYLQQFLKRGIPQQLPEEQREKLAALLDVPEEKLRGTSPLLPAKEYAKLNNIIPIGQNKSAASVDARVDIASTLQPLFGESDLPVYGTAQAGTEGVLIMSKVVVEYTARPAPLLRVRDGYGMIVTGESMSPMVEPGYIVLVHPFKPARAGKLCILRSTGADDTVRVTVKQFRRESQDVWHVRQINPERDFSLKKSEWQECHLVVGVYFD